MKTQYLSAPKLAFIWALALVAISGCASGVNKAHKTSFRADESAWIMTPPTSRVLIAAHRGCHSRHPENSIAAFNYCAEIGVEVAELDFTMTADNRLIIFHDDVMERMTDGEGRPYELTFAELRKMRLRSGDGGDDAELTREQIPTLAEISERVASKLYFMVDIKATPTHSRERILAEIVRQASALGMNKRMLWMVNTPQQIEIVNLGSKENAIIMPSVRRVGQPQGATLTDLSEADGVFGAQVLYLNPGDENWFASQSATLGKKKLHIFGYNRVDSETDPTTAAKGWNLLLELGSTGIVTDRPEQLAMHLQKRGLR